MEKNTELLSKALRLLPEVKNTVVHPNEGQEYSKPLGKGDSVRIDFGRHLVGHLKLKLGYTDSHPDAPVWLKFSFAENLKEFDEDVENYNGWICSAWVQQEQVHVDVVPGDYELPRRYSFRYVKIDVLDIKSQEPDAFEKAKSMLMIPDYLNFLLTGEKVQEYTNATTTQLVNPVTKDWDYELIDRLGYPKDIFGEIKNPGSEVGKLRSEVSRKVGFDCKVILPATHDTASAVMAVPTQKDDTLYISSGTWSLMGTELVSADCSSLSMEHNLTNEGGYDYRFRYLKNIMGLWMIQSVRKEIVPDMSFGQICELASKEPIKSIVDVNDNRFLAPLNMTEEVKRACAESGQQVPDSIAQIAAVIYNSLAECYASTVKEIEGLTHKNYEYIHIVGGGANAGYLNELTANETRKTVYAGPTEATAIGNIASQMIADGKLKDLKDARRCIFDSFEIKEYNPDL